MYRLLLTLGRFGKKLPGDLLLPNTAAFAAGEGVEELRASYAEHTRRTRRGPNLSPTSIMLVSMDELGTHPGRSSRPRGERYRQPRNMASSKYLREHSTEISEGIQRF